MKNAFFVIAVSISILFMACEKESNNIILNAEDMPAITTQKTYGGSQSEGARAIVHSSDGHYVIAGTTNSSDGDVSSFKGGSGDAWLLKTKEDGEMVWESCIGGSDWDWLTDVIQSKAGTYFAVGRSRSNDGNVSGNHGATDGLIAKVDNEGAVLWTRQYGGSSDDEFSSITQTADGNFVAVGYTQSDIGDAISHAWIVKFDTNGEIIWEKAYGGSGEEDANAVVATADGGIAVGGLADSNNGDVDGQRISNQAGWFLKLDADGKIEWQRIVQEKEEGIINDIAVTNNGDFILVGVQNGRRSQIAAFTLLMDKEGNTESVITPNDQLFASAQAVIALPSGEFYVVGYSSLGPGEIEKVTDDEEAGFIQLNLEQTEVAFVKLNATARGVLEFGVYGGFGDDKAYGVTVNSANQAVVVGETSSDRLLVDNDIRIEQKGESDVWLLELGEVD